MIPPTKYFRFCILTGFFWFVFSPFPPDQEAKIPGTDCSISHASKEEILHKFNLLKYDEKIKFLYSQEAKISFSTIRIIAESKTGFSWLAYESYCSGITCKEAIQFAQSIPKDTREEQEICRELFRYDKAEILSFILDRFKGGCIELKYVLYEEFLKRNWEELLPFTDVDLSKDYLPKAINADPDAPTFNQLVTRYVSVMRERQQSSSEVPYN
jgi:hypothetical protein